MVKTHYFSFWFFSISSIQWINQLLLSLLYSRRDGLKEFIHQEFPQVTNVALVVIRKRTIVKMMTHSDKKGYENPPAGTVLDKMVTNK